LSYISIQYSAEIMHVNGCQQRENFQVQSDFSKFDRPYPRFPLSEFLQIFTVPSDPWVLSNWWKLGDSNEGFKKKKLGAKYGQKCNIQTPISPKNGGWLPPNYKLFLSGPQEP